MTDNQTPAYGLSEADLERAAEAVYDGMGHIALAASDDHHLADEFTEEEFDKWEWDVPYSVFKGRGMALGSDEGFAHRDLVRIVDRVLTVLGPAIREATVREMIADVHRRLETRGPTIYESVMLSRLAKYLPATEPDAESGAAQ